VIFDPNQSISYRVICQ